MDSDDYFQDQLELDDHDLFILDQEEAKYATQARRITPPPTPPPAKRQKLSNTKEILIKSDDVPEIQLEVNGTYDLGSATPSLVGAQRVEAFNKALGSGTQARIVDVRVQATTPNPEVALVGPNDQFCSQNGDGNPPRQTMFDAAVQHRLVPTHTQPSSTEIQSTQGRRSLQRTESMRSKNIELVLLQSEIEQLKRNQAKLEDLLKSERNQRYAKEGEVSVLRKNIEKTQKDHANHVAALQASREAAEARQAETQKKLKEEMEKLRTEFTFKKHELENTAFRTSMTAKTKRMSGAHMNSPVPIPEAMRGWNSKRTNGAQASPSRQSVPMSQRMQGSQKAGKSAEPSFPGFENSFLQSSPTKSPSARKARQRAAPSESEIRTGNNSFIGATQKTSKGKGRIEREQMLSSPTKNRLSVKLTKIVSPKIHRLDKDVDMRDLSSSPTRSHMLTDDFPDDAIGDFDDINDSISRMDLVPNASHDVLSFASWDEELHALFLTHTCSKSSVFTLQALFSVVFPDHVPHDVANLYQKGCASLLEAMGEKYLGVKPAFKISRALLTMARVLFTTSQYQPLELLFDLILSLIVCVPSFLGTVVRSILSDDRNAPQDASPFMTLLCDILNAGLQSGVPDGTVEDESHEVIRALGLLVLKIMEIMCWSLDKDDVFLLSSIVGDARIFCTALGRNQPSKYCIYALRVLAGMSCHACLCQPLVEVRDSQDPTKADPLLNRLAKLLVDKRPLSLEVHGEADQLILRIFGLLSIGDCCGHQAVVRCEQAIPAMVMFLHNAISKVYEEDEFIKNDQDAALELIEMTHEIVDLLSYLAFFNPANEGSSSSSFRTEKRTNRGPGINLFNVLSAAPPIPYNGSLHDFITTISRISYINPPEWLSEKARSVLGSIADPARELLELVIQQPDCDSVWEALQGSDDDDQETQRDPPPGDEDFDMIGDILDEC